MDPCSRGLLPRAYLTQAVQSREFPVPLVAGENALLRVFVTAPQGSADNFPPVRARFYDRGRERYVLEMPGTPTPVPAEVSEGIALDYGERGSSGRDRAAGPGDGHRDRPGGNAGTGSRIDEADSGDRTAGGGGPVDAHLRPDADSVPLAHRSGPVDRGPGQRHGQGSREPGTALGHAHAAADRRSSR